jgi:predicted nuclease of predicted toxin-antitoxin system
MRRSLRLQKKKGNDTIRNYIIIRNDLKCIVEAHLCLQSIWKVIVLKCENLVNTKFAICSLLLEIGV